MHCLIWLSRLDAVTTFESDDGWTVEAYYTEHPDSERLTKELGALLSFAYPKSRWWRSLTRTGWPSPSRPAARDAGRFTVHGSHDRGLVPRGPNTLLIDAGEAFGTAHHATTQGCLMALDRVTRRRQFESVLDLGCGSGVLAIAAARALPGARIEASDNDPVAICGAHQCSAQRRCRAHSDVGGRWATTQSCS